MFNIFKKKKQQQNPYKTYIREVYINGALFTEEFKMALKEDLDKYWQEEEKRNIKKSMNTRKLRKLIKNNKQLAAVNDAALETANEHDPRTETVSFLNRLRAKWLGVSAVKQSK